MTPGLVKLHVGTSSSKVEFTHELILHGPRRVVGFDRQMLTPVVVRPVAWADFGSELSEP